MVVLKNVCGVHPYFLSREYYGFCPPNPIFRSIPAPLFFVCVFLYCVDAILTFLF